MALYASQSAAPAAPVAQPQNIGVGPSSNVNLLAGLNLGGFPGPVTQQINGGFPTQVVNNTNGLNNHFGGLNLGMPGQQSNQQQMFGAHFGPAAVPQQMPAQFMNGGGGGFYHNGNVGGIMGQPPNQAPPPSQAQGMHHFPGAANGGIPLQQPQQPQMNPMMMQGQGGIGVKGGFNMGQQQPQQFPFGGAFGAGQPSQLQPQQPQQMMMGQGFAAGSANGNGTTTGAGLQKPLGNLNLGNVWQ